MTKRCAKRMKDSVKARESVRRHFVTHDVVADRDRLGVFTSAHDFKYLAAFHETFPWAPDEFGEYIGSCADAYDSAHAEGRHLYLVPLDLEMLEQTAAIAGLNPDSCKARDYYIDEEVSYGDLSPWCGTFDQWWSIQQNSRAVDAWANKVALGLPMDVDDDTLFDAMEHSGPECVNEVFVKIEADLSNLYDSVSDLLFSTVFGFGLRTVAVIRNEESCFPAVDVVCAEISEGQIKTTHGQMEAFVASMQRAYCEGGTILVSQYDDHSDTVCRFAWQLRDQQVIELPYTAVAVKYGNIDLVRALTRKITHPAHLFVAPFDENDTFIEPTVDGPSWEKNAAHATIDTLLATGQEFLLTLHEHIDDAVGEDSPQVIIRGWLATERKFTCLGATETKDMGVDVTGWRTDFADGWPV